MMQWILDNSLEHHQRGAGLESRAGEARAGDHQDGHRGQDREEDPAQVQEGEDRALELDAACADLPDSLRVRDHGKLPPQDGDAERAQR